jgi:alkylation response protein AidB-like acyl-CoA dehydrogenase
MTALRAGSNPDEQRQSLRSWLADHESPTASQLATAGLVAPHWPRPWGLDADPHLQLIVAEELAAAGVGPPENMIGIGWAGPTIVAGGTAEQQQRWLPGILDGSDE